MPRQFQDKLNNDDFISYFELNLCKSFHKLNQSTHVFFIEHVNQEMFSYQSKEVKDTLSQCVRKNVSRLSSRFLNTT